MKNIYETIETICIAFVLMAGLIMLGVRPVTVDGVSMDNTLSDNDRLIISNFFYTPEVGDIVVIDQNTIFEKPIIKRVIAVGGDTIKIDYSTGDVYVNDILLNEPYILEKINPSEKNNIELLVPDGHVFVMGDNRNNSDDSRLPQLGTVSHNLILGEVLLRIYPLESFGTVS